jgi:hypothetical protein
MSKKDYERAAKIVQDYGDAADEMDSAVRWIIADAFVNLFAPDNPLFDAERFRLACVPGANVKARLKRKVT